MIHRMIDPCAMVKIELFPLCLNCDLQYIYIYTFINRWLVGIGEIEKFELKIGVFDRNESERNLPREKVEI